LTGSQAPATLLILVYTFVSEFSSNKRTISGRCSLSNVSRFSSGLWRLPSWLPRSLKLGYSGIGNPTVFITATTSVLWGVPYASVP
jgi:hypothetical protein